MPVRAMVWSMRGTMRKLVRFVWAMLGDLFYHICFRTPLRLGASRGLKYNHVRMFYVLLGAFVFIPFWVVPWTGLAIWYIVPVKGCESYSTRRYLEDFCMQPDLNPDKEIHWYKDIWNHQTDYADYLDTLPPSIEAIFTSHLKLFDAHISLLGQASKLADNHSASPTLKTLKSNLDGVIGTLSDLAKHWESFSKTFCIEKDNLNHAFRALVEAYSTAITSDHHELSYSSVFGLPSAHMFRFYNSLFEIRWLPQPKLYRRQVKAEICFRITRFIEESIAALDRIDKKFPPSRRFHSSMSQTLGGVITTIDAYQRDHEAKIAELPWWRRIQKPKDIEALKDTLALANRIHELMLEAKKLAETNDAYSKRLRSQLQNLRENLGDSLSIELSSRSVLDILDPSLDDLDSIDGTRISTLRSKIAQMCQDPHHSNNVPRELHMVCFIYALGTTFSQIDDDVLRSVQRSWLMERKEAISRYELMTGSDLNSQVDLGLKIYQAYKDGAPRPSDF